MLLTNWAAEVARGGPSGRPLTPAEDAEALAHCRIFGKRLYLCESTNVKNVWPSFIIHHSHTTTRWHLLYCSSSFIIHQATPHALLHRHGGLSSAPPRSGTKNCISVWTHVHNGKPHQFSHTDTARVTGLRIQSELPRPWRADGVPTVHTPRPSGKCHRRPS